MGGGRARFSAVWEAEDAETRDNWFELPKVWMLFGAMVRRVGEEPIVLMLDWNHTDETPRSSIG
jgi:hypothetical protein